MLGLAGAFTPAATGNVLLVVSGVWSNSSGSGNGMSYAIYAGTGTAPANGAAVTGTLQGATPQATSTGASVKQPFALQAFAPGLTIGSAYWFDLAFDATAGTNTISEVTISAAEV
jgi:hypothetical protein